MNVKELKINDLGAAFFFELVFLVLTDPAAITLGFAAIIHSLSHSHSPRQFHFALPQINVKMLRGCERNSILVGTGNTQHSIDPVIHLTWVSMLEMKGNFYKYSHALRQPLACGSNCVMLAIELNLQFDVLFLSRAKSFGCNDVSSVNR